LHSTARDAEGRGSRFHAERRNEKSPSGALHPRRGAALLLELATAGVLLGIVMSAAVPTLGWIVRERQLSRQRQTAILEAGNVMERMRLLDWESLTPEKAAKFELSDALRNELPDARLTVSVTDDAGAKARRVLVELRWEPVAGRPAPPVRLAAWFHSPEQAL
jgi:hypothetical protein